MHRIFWLILPGLLGLSPAAGAQDVFQGNATTARLPSDLYNAAEPAPDLDKYLSPDGRFIDACRYWHDHPDSTTLLYGQPDAFPRGQIGQTEGVNGQPAPYVRCAVNPCPPNGFICWRNPAKPTPLNAQLQAVLRAQGCEAQPNGDIYCQQNRMPHPGPPSPRLSSGMVKSVCRVIGGGISCNPGSSPQPSSYPETFSGKDDPSQIGVGGPDYIRQTVRWLPPPPPLPWARPSYTPLDWNHVPVCPRPGSSSGGGFYLNYFWSQDPWHSDAEVSWISDPQYITVGGHGGPGSQGVGACPWDKILYSPRRIATDLHTLLALPGNGSKRVRLAVCESAEPNPKDPSSVPLAQQVADAYREIYGTPLNVEGYNGTVQYGRASRLQDFPCRVFTSRTPLPAN
jgi:hypothetical protein